MTRTKRTTTNDNARRGTADLTNERLAKENRELKADLAALNLRLREIGIALETHTSNGTIEVVLSNRRAELLQAKLGDLTPQENKHE